MAGPGIYGYKQKEPEAASTAYGADGGWVVTPKPPAPRGGVYQGFNPEGVDPQPLPYTVQGVMPYDNTGALLPQYAGQYPGQVGVPDPSHLPVWAGGTLSGYTEPPKQTIAPTTEQALAYGAEIGRLSAAIDTLKANIASGKGDISAETRKLISYSQRLAALVEKAKGTPNPELAQTPPATPAEPVNTNPNNAPAGPPAAPLPTDLLVGNPVAPPPDYQKASDTNIKYAENMQKAAAKTNDKAAKKKYIDRAKGYSQKAQDYGTKITQKPAEKPNA